MSTRLHGRRRRDNEDENISLNRSSDELCNDSTVDIVRVFKQYNDNIFALENVSLQFNSNEITVLLGKNGAGKTTLIHVMTSLIEPTSGHVDGPSTYGFCPQHDIVWPELTVEDHFKIFGKLRGMDNDSIVRQSDHLLQILGFFSNSKTNSNSSSDEGENHRSISVSKLSGGMRRKLAVGLAFLGDAKCVILDEPTSGLDPFSRRQLWDAILQLKDNRIVLLSTHYMDEAEVMGDRIVILADGKVCANGSAIQLRRQFDCGYTFTVKTEKQENFLLSKIGNSVHSIVPEVSVAVFSDRAEIFVPMEFENMIEPILTELGNTVHSSSSITVESTRLEEVFMRVTSTTSSPQDRHPDDITTDSPYENFQRFENHIPQLVTTRPSIRQSILAIITKRFRMFVRDLRSSCSQHLYPILVILFGIFVRESVNKQVDDSVSTNDHLSKAPPTDSLMQSMDNLMLVLFVSVAFSSIPTSISQIINTEKHSHSKFLQYISGLSPTAYWLGNFVADLSEYLLFPFAFTIALFHFFATAIPTQPLLCLLALFGPAIIAQTYFMTILIPNPLIAQLVSVLVSTIVGGILPMIGFMFTQAQKFLSSQNLDGNDENSFSPNSTLDTILSIARVFPAYNLGQGLVTIPMADLMGSLLHALNPSSPAAGIYAWNNLGASLFWLAISIPFYLALTLVIDNAIYTHKFSRIVNCLWRRNTTTGFIPLSATENGGEEEDESISREREKVLDVNNPPLLRVIGVSKQYSITNQLLAVNRVCLGVPPSGEIFGLLGHNGAGKSTLMKLCTGEILPTNGDIVLTNQDDLNTKTDVARFHSIVGYCPQFDALIDHLTVRDHFELYGVVKGVERGQVLSAVVSDTIARLGLTEYEFSKVKHLSGGYKRRVSLGIALIGTPVLLLLDEPTCGMDPVARRQTWSVIKSVTARETSVVLTTHSMEEAEAISTRVGIMSRGKMVCLGSVDELREKFSNGIEIFVQTKFPTILPELFTQINNKSFLLLCEEHSVKRAKRFLSSGFSMLTTISSSPVLFAQWWSQEELNDKIEECVWQQVSSMGTTISSVNASGRSIRMVLVPQAMTIDFLVTVFALLSKIRVSGDIVDFSVNQNSLEQVFNSITAIEADVDGDRDQSAEHISQLQ